MNTPILRQTGQLVWSAGETPPKNLSLPCLKSSPDQSDCPCVSEHEVRPKPTTELPDWEIRALTET